MLFKNQKSTYYHPGIYRFYWPYVSPNLQYHDADHILFWYYDVEIHVGRSDDMKEGKLLTVIIKSSTLGVTNHIEYIATQIRNNFFPDLFLQYQENKKHLNEDVIRWLEVNFETLNPDCWSEVTLEWDHRSEQYQKPEWKKIDPNAWYFVQYQSKFNDWLKAALESFNGGSFAANGPRWIFELKEWIGDNLKNPDLAIVEALNRVLEHGHSACDFLSEKIVETFENEQFKMQKQLEKHGRDPSEPTIKAHS